MCTPIQAKEVVERLEEAGRGGRQGQGRREKVTQSNGCMFVFLGYPAADSRGLNPFLWQEEFINSFLERLEGETLGRMLDYLSTELTHSAVSPQVLCSHQS